MFHGLLRWLPALVWMGVIFYWSSQSVLPIDGMPNSRGLHDIAHVVAYAILALLLALGGGTSRRGLLAAFLLATVYGIGDEFHQSFVPGRHAGLQEIAIDSASAAAALGLVARLLAPVRHRLFIRKASKGRWDGLDDRA